MKVIDLIIKQFNYELKDKTMFKILNQENHDKYIYNIDDNKFHEYRVGSGEMENISLVIDKATIDWDIEIIEEGKAIEEINITYQDNHSQEEINEYLRCSINEIVKAVNELKKVGK